jgi:WD40 repeat protein
MENSMLKQRVQELTSKLRILEIEKESLQVEVEQYRREMVVPNFSTALTLGTTTKSSSSSATKILMQSGDGIFCKVPAVIVKMMTTTTTMSNRLCGCLDSTDRILAIGHADGTLQLQFWGDSSSSSSSTTTTTTLRFPAPVITCRFHRNDILAIGCMDGACMVAQLYYNNTTITACVTPPLTPRHDKYVKHVCFPEEEKNSNTTTNRPIILATSSADGNIHLYKIERNHSSSDNEMMITDEYGNDESEPPAAPPKVSHVHSLHLDKPVEAMVVFANPYKLICHVRDSPHLYVFEDDDDTNTAWELKHTIDIHEGNGGFENHVSFCILDLQVSPDGHFLACATDAHRHIILDLHHHNNNNNNNEKYRIVRNLYGHHADNYSAPVIAWSANSQYLYSNHQHEAKIVVYEIASGKIVSELTSPHTRPIKSLYSSKTSNTLVSISWDRSTILWFTE